MVKPKFTIKVGKASFLAGKPNSKAEVKVQRKKINVKEILIQQAVSWCKENNKRDYAALQTGMFSLIKD